MIRLLPGVYAVLVCLLSIAYGKWRRGRGSPLKGRETIRIMLVIFAVSFPAIGLYFSMISSGMTLRDRLEMFLASLVLGILPLVIGLCFWGALRLVRVYIDHAGAAARNDSH